ncbi:BTAD domain-containing putative transcriptional regulator [Streptomyces sp. H10-C2]|uniref:AfsR/SARP family transcriptional regulator n=1 Tax=unclassified Streptomyces TaxID=2593676 RepID=UPI0024BB1DE0|nr:MULTISPECIES: BTAD domain-containing putative transcriptional regulator [unclassified Streptomyces]MDJ0346196.1 BTAD domain-containing putative transcriptional regulator [Streptomyces sp. PH10-H1]MDJ0371147.1 BTAD domain-containing putative transcriptional regulator [Streptomyces sp. H10-C2]
MAVEFGVLGSIEARIDGRPAQLGHARQRGVLAVLLVDVNHPVTTDQLMDRVWGDRIPQQARGTLHGYLSRLRQALAATGEVKIARQHGGYVLTTADTATVDLYSFRRLIAQARTSADDHRAATLFEQALRLWRGDAFASMDTPWINALRDTLDQERLAAQMDLVDLQLRLGHHTAVLPELSARTAAQPLDERLAGQLILALHLSGRPADALAHYQHTRRRLAQELGIGPGPALRDIEATVLRQDTAAVPPPPPPPARARPSTTPAQLPLAIATFTGRELELAHLDGLLSGPDRARPPAVVISAVSGTAGVGKTALAMHWAHRVAARYADGQLYVNLRGFDPRGLLVDPADALRGFLAALGVPVQRIPAGLDARAALYRSLLTGRHVLVVLDNARDVEQIRPLLPGSPGCLVVVTSRNQLTPLVVAEDAHPLTLDLLSVAEAHDLLTRRLGAGRTEAEPDAVTEIITRCTRLPLALAITSARAATRPALPLSALAAELRAAAGALDAFHGDDPASDVRTVFSWSYRALSADAARLFRLLGLHPGPDITAAASAGLAGVPRDRALRSLAELTRAHLLTEDVPGRYAFHDLLRAYAAELVATQDSNDARHTAVHRMLDHYLYTAVSCARLMNLHWDPIPLPRPQPGVVPETVADHDAALVWLTAEYPVLLAVIEQAAGSEFDTHRWQLPQTLTDFFERRGYWHDWAAVQRGGLAAAHRLADRLAQAQIHRGLGRAHMWLDHHDEARAHYEQALTAFQDLDDRVGQSRTHHNLCQMADMRDLPEAALIHAQQALELIRPTGDMSGIAKQLSTVGWCHGVLGDHRQALAHCQEALTLQQELRDHSQQLATWDSIGYAHHHLGDHRQAVHCYLKSLSLSRDIGDRHGEANALTHLGDVHHAAGSTDAAHTAWKAALIILDDLSHPDAGQIRAKLDDG